MKRKRIETILHLVIVIAVFCAVGVYFVPALAPQGDGGAVCLKFFTTDSNILALAGSLCCLLFTRGGKRPRWVSALHFAGTVCVSLTFLTVVVFLAPTAAILHEPDAVAFFFKGNAIILHAAAPVLSFITLLLAGDEHPRADCLWALLPVFVYSMVYLTAVVFLRVWDDLYGFTLGGHYALAPIVLAVMYAATLLLAAAERKAARKAAEKYGKGTEK